MTIKKLTDEMWAEFMGVGNETDTLVRSYNNFGNESYRVCLSPMKNSSSVGCVAIATRLHWFTR
jgi:hypothetical protein